MSLAVGAAGSMPLDGCPRRGHGLSDGTPGACGAGPRSPGYFEAAGIQAVARPVARLERLRANSGAALISQSAAAAAFPGRDPLGRNVHEHPRATLHGRRHRCRRAEVARCSGCEAAMRRPRTSFLAVDAGPPDDRGAHAAGTCVATTCSSICGGRSRRWRPGHPVAAGWWARADQRAVGLPQSAISDHRAERVRLPGDRPDGHRCLCRHLFPRRFAYPRDRHSCRHRGRAGARSSAHMVRQATVPAVIGVAGGLAATDGWPAGRGAIVRGEGQRSS